MFDRGKETSLVRMALSALLMLNGAATAIAAPNDSQFASQLIDAARNHDLTTIRSLVSQHADVNARSEDGSTALLWAAHADDLEAANLLLNAGADPNVANDFKAHDRAVASLYQRQRDAGTGAPEEGSKTEHSRCHRRDPPDDMRSNR